MQEHSCLEPLLLRARGGLHAKREELRVSTVAMAPSLTPVQTPSLALMLATSPNRRGGARRPSAEGYDRRASHTNVILGGRAMTRLQCFLMAALLPVPAEA